MTRPARLQLSRKRGFDLQAHSRAVNGLKAVNVARGPGRRWGNPFPVDHPGTAMHAMSMQLDPDDAQDRAAAAVDLFRTWVLRGKVNELVWAMLPTVERQAPMQRIIERDLRGKNLACWCNGAPCHADVLLELANQKAHADG